MAIVTVNTECPSVVRRVRRMIRSRMGEEAATVFSEAMANVREHGGCHAAELVLHNRRFEVKNVAFDGFPECSAKPAGEGGYGVHIMERMGAFLEMDNHYCCVRWRHHGSDEYQTV